MKFKKKSFLKNYIQKKTKIKRRNINNRKKTIKHKNKNIKHSKKYKGGSRIINTTYIELKSNCNNELKDKKCYNFNEGATGILNCSSIPNINESDLKVSLDNLFDNKKYYYLQEGGFNTVFKLDVNNETKAVIRLTHNLNCDKRLKAIKGELKGLYFQTLFSKSVKDGGYGCNYICKVYDFGIYAFETDSKPRIPTDSTFSSTGGVYGILENLSGGDLLDMINSEKWFDLDKTIRLKATINILTQLLNGVGCIHDHGYVHLDLKPENIMITSKWEESVRFEQYVQNIQIKIIDFGFIHKIGDPLPSSNVGESWVGSPGFVSDPFYQSSAKTYKKNFDLWSISMIIYRCLMYKQQNRGENIGLPINEEDIVRQFWKKLFWGDYRDLRETNEGEIMHTFIEKVRKFVYIIGDPILTNDISCYYFLPDSMGIMGETEPAKTLWEGMGEKEPVFKSGYFNDNWEKRKFILKNKDGNITLHRSGGKTNVYIRLNSGYATITRNETEKSIEIICNEGEECITKNLIKRTRWKIKFSEATTYENLITELTKLNKYGLIKVNPLSAEDLVR
jgi:serine/threonine protein kinase